MHAPQPLMMLTRRQISSTRSLSSPVFAAAAERSSRAFIAPGTDMIGLAILIFVLPVVIVFCPVDPAGDAGVTGTPKIFPTRSAPDRDRRRQRVPTRS